MSTVSQLWETKNCSYFIQMSSNDEMMIKIVNILLKFGKIRTVRCFLP